MIINYRTCKFNVDLSISLGSFFLNFSQGFGSGKLQQQKFLDLLNCPDNLCPYKYRNHIIMSVADKFTTLTF